MAPSVTLSMAQQPSWICNVWRPFGVPSESFVFIPKSKAPYLIQGYFCVHKTTQIQLGETWFIFLFKMIEIGEELNDIYDDALANWHTLNERVKKSGPVRDWTQACGLPNKTCITAAHRITMVPRQIQTNQEFTLHMMYQATNCI